MAKAKSATSSVGAAPEVKGRRVPIADIPAVQEVVDLKQRIDALKAENPEVFMQFDDLVDRYNSSIEEAEATVRAKGVTCGPFENFSVSHSIDAEKMWDELGEKQFLACGGKVGQVAKYTVDAASVKAAIASGKIPTACVSAFTTTKRSYHSPKKIVLG